MAENNNAPKKQRDRIAMILYTLYVIMLVASVVLVGRLVQLQLLWKPDKNIEQLLTQRSRKVVLEPTRGNILAEDGRLLAMSYPKYQIAMDPGVRKEEFSRLDAEKREEAEAKWRSKAKELAVGLAKVFPQKSADDHYNTIIQARKSGKRYLRIGKPIEIDDLNYLKTLPLFNEGRYKGGIWEETVNVRRYPFGKLAYRTIGFVRNNVEGVSNNFVGLDGKFNYILHGEEGEMHLKNTDNGPVRDQQAPYIKAVDGVDIRTTLNIDYQDIADRALRSQIENVYAIEEGCCILMDVKTGAIRAMVNLSRDPKTGRMEEVSNHAIGRLFEPGSVFKTTTLVSAIEDGYYNSLDETMPTNHGFISGYKYEQDVHILDLERRDHKYNVDLLWGLSHSSNYVFRNIAIMHYEKQPKKLLEHLYIYQFGSAFDFDIDGLRTPIIPSPDSKTWSKTDLGQIAMGYSVLVTPIHVLNFYNAIANKGKMMKPYLVEDIEKDGKVIEKRGPTVLQASICSKATADTVSRGLRAVAEEGTASYRLRKAKAPVAGKTGTSFATFENGQYSDANGNKKYQGTFVGFFPDDDPQYSIICSVFSAPTKQSFQGGGLPAQAVRIIVDEIHDIDPYWKQPLNKTN